MTLACSAYGVNYTGERWPEPAMRDAENLRDLMEAVGLGVDVAGVVIIVVGAVIATIRAVAHVWRGGDDPYSRYRQNLGRAILLGLEFLVAGDIIRTVVVSPTLENVAALGLIVLIRTFLSIALEVELEGRFPWQRSRAEK